MMYPNIPNPDARLRLSLCQDSMDVNLPTARAAFFTSQFRYLKLVDDMLNVWRREDFSDSTIAAAIVDRKPTSRVVRSSRISLSESPVRNTEATLPVTPSRIALPASPARMLSNAVARIRPEVDGVVANVHRAAEQLEVEKDKALATTKRVSFWVIWYNWRESKHAPIVHV